MGLRSEDALEKLNVRKPNLRVRHYFSNKEFLERVRNTQLETEEVFKIWTKTSGEILVATRHSTPRGLAVYGYDDFEPTGEYSTTDVLQKVTKAEVQANNITNMDSALEFAKNRQLKNE